MCAIRVGGIQRGVSSKGMRRSIAAPLSSGAPPTSSPPTTSSGMGLTNLPIAPSVQDQAADSAINVLNAMTGGLAGVVIQDVRFARQLVQQLQKIDWQAVKQKAQDLFSSLPEISFDLPVGYEDEAPLEGAVYHQTQKVFGNEEKSRVKAIYRIQMIVNTDAASPLLSLGIASGTSPLGSVLMMFEAGFLYQLDHDEDGFIYQMPAVPKLEAGVGLEAEGTSRLKGLLELKGETTIEQTFVWIRIGHDVAFWILGVLLLIFNISPTMFKIRFRGCEENPKDARLPIDQFFSSGVPSTRR